MTFKDTFARLSVIYGTPPAENAKAFVAEYQRVFDEFDKRFHDEACNIVIDTHAFPSWPKPADVRKALHAAAAKHSKPIDWDAVEAERREGWKFSDLEKTAKNRGPEWQERHSQMMSEWREFMGTVASDAQLADGVDWQKGQRDEFERMQRESPNQGLHRTKAGMS